MCNKTCSFLAVRYYYICPVSFLLFFFLKTKRKNEKTTKDLVCSEFVP